MKYNILSEIRIAAKQSPRLFFAPFVGAYKEIRAVVESQAQENVERWRRQDAEVDERARKR